MSCPRFLGRTDGLPSGDRTRRRAGAVLVALTLLAGIGGGLPVSAASPVGAGGADHREPGEPRLYLLTLRVGGRTLAAHLPAYSAHGTHYLAFRELLHAVEFQVARTDGVWSGWWSTPENRFRWAPDEQHSPPTARPISIETEDGTCVATSQLEKWFDLEIDVDERRQVVRVRSEHPLPFEQREARAARRARARSAGPTAPPVAVRDEYRHFTLPMLDVSTHAHWRGGEGGTSDSQSLAVDLGMDLLKHSVVYDGRTSRSSDAHSETRQRLTLSRRAATVDGALGLGVTGYEIGDVFSTGRNLVDGGGAGRGALIERRRRPGRDASLTQVTIAGDARPGWDVELYRNGRLVAFGVVDDEGRWVFEDVTTVRGENVFVARLFGPQGQRESQRQVVWGGGADLARGDGEFRLSHVDYRERLIDGRRDEDEFLPAERLSDARGSYGLTKDIQVGAAWSRASVTSRKDSEPARTSDYVSLFTRANVGRGLLLAEAVQQLDAGNAWSVQYLTSLSGHDLSVSHESHDHYESPRTRREAPVRSRSRVSLAGPLPGLGFEHYLLRATHEDRLGGGDQLRVFTRLAARWGRFIVTNDLELERHDGGDERVGGRVRASARWNGMNLSAALDHQLTDDEPLKQFVGTLRYRPHRNLNATWTVRKGLAASDDVSLEALVSARHRGVDYTLRSSFGSDDRWSVGLGVLLHLGRTEAGGGWLSEDRALAQSGRASLAFFLDRNRNGRRDPEEPAVEGVSYESHEASEHEPGVVPLGAVPAETPLIVETSRVALDDPFLVPSEERYEIYTHAGGDLRLDVPVVETVDLGGTLVLPPGNEPTLSGLWISLVDDEGRELGRTRPEADGYFLLERVPPGRHSLIVKRGEDDHVQVRRRVELRSDAGFNTVEPIDLKAAVRGVGQGDRGTLERAPRLEETGSPRGPTPAGRPELVVALEPRLR